MRLPRSYNFVTFQDDGLAPRVMILGVCGGTQLVTFLDDVLTSVLLIMCARSDPACLPLR